ncbi:P-loop containing nucleoside triphosphate hydrolase protein [Amanita muscaria]
MDTTRAGRLEKFLAKILGSSVPVPVNQKDLFIDAICAQDDKVHCINRLVGSKNGIPSIRAALRYDCSDKFVNNRATDLLKYFMAPEIEGVSGGSYLEKILVGIVIPPIFWEALCAAFDRKLLGAEAETCFAWLMYKLISFQTSEADLFRAIAREKDYIDKFLNSSSHETKKYAQQMKHLLETGKVAITSDGGSSPGGRHDNDFLDFREIAIIPTVEEMLSSKEPFLRTTYFLDNPSTKDDRVSIYLDNQFRLLREDMLSEMREEIHVALGRTKRRYKPHIYQGLQVLDIHFGPDDKKRTKWALRFKLGDDLPVFKNNKKIKDRVDYLKKHRRILSHQSPTCIIVDGDLVAFALVDRDETALAQKPPVIGLQFEGETATSKILSKLKSGKDIKLLSVDVAVFSYEPILRAIQRTNQLPLNQELLFWEASALVQLAPPKDLPYAIITRLKLNLCQDLQPLLGTAKSMMLDKSQGESFLNGLTQRVSLIQGPPGTGKSFIGALLAKTIHDHTGQSILVVCYTNHALDQFLEDLIDIGIPVDSIVRLGGIGKATSRTVQLALQNQTSTFRFSPTDRKILDDLKQEIELKRSQLESLFKLYRGSSSTPEAILDWLEFEEPGLFEAFQVPRSEDGMVSMHKGKPVKDTYLFDQWRTGWPPHLFIKLTQRQPDLWAMKQTDRQSRVKKWEDEIEKEALSNFYSVAKQYNELIHQLQRKFSERDTHTLQNKRIIGCTTTGAAKYTELLQSVSPSVLLVEEAGEILESHILTALGREKNQLILIGDHKQLRPKVNSYPLTVEKGDGFDLNRSLFERLVLKGYPHTALSQQHRMRPEISALVRHLTYPDLVDAPRTQGRPDLRGVTDNLIMITHSKPEDEMTEIADRAEGAKSSKQNTHEVQMVLKIVRYLSQQGYGTDNMVVLTPYLGQLQKLMTALKDETDPVLNDLDSHELVRAGLLSTADANARKRPLRLATIDNYQGEESDIVIVSLTRSNPEHDIGFMYSPERVNVMLSRARNALIMIGNTDTFGSARKGRELWTSLLDLLKKGGHIYEGLPVRCERHPKKTTILKSPEDFDNEAPDGGCKQPCGIPMDCGIHQCQSSCHRTTDHSRMRCQILVFSKCSDGHDTSYHCHKGPSSVCSLCEKERRHVEKEQKDDLARQQRHEQEKKVHELKMADLERQIKNARQDIRDAQTAAEREQVKLQKEEDLQQAQELAKKAHHLPTPNLPNSSSQPTQPPASPDNGTTNPTSLAPVINNVVPPSVNPANPDSSLPDEWKLKPSDSEAQWKRQKDLEGARDDAIDAIMQLTGLESVKTQLLRIKSKIDTAQRQNSSLAGERFNIVFLGNPGTGKTTVARQYAKFLSNVGILPGNTFEETTGSRISNGGVDGAKKLVEGVLKAGGGAIFIDEAYQLTSESNHQGGQVLDFLLAEMENNADKLVFILAGYSKQMEKFFEHNPGLTSRVPYQITFQDYENAELLHMLVKLIEKKWGGQMAVESGLTGLYARIFVTRLGRGRGTNGFGNARALQNMFSKIWERQADRIDKERRQGGRPNDFLLTGEDFIGPPPGKVMNESKAWKKLQEMIGLDTVKNAVRDFFVLVETNYLRELSEKPIMQFSLNRCFLGPPGTGKTTVAQLFGSILRDLNLLSNGEVVLKNPSDFVGAHLGHSEKNTRQILESTKGKVLVIDEAYMMYSGSKSGGNNSDSFKTAVIDTIVAEVQGTPSDDRCVLLLGYEDQMNEMFQNVNPGLSRRFDIERAFRFENFNDTELLQILNLKLKQQGLEATDAAKKTAIDLLSRARNRPNFGNGGEVENILGRAKARSQQRLGPVPQIILEPADFDPDHDRSQRAASNLEKLFGDVIGCEEVIQKLRDYQKIAKTMSDRGMDPRNKIPMSFVFKGPPGTGKTTTARKMGQVYYDMGFLAAAEVIECSASDLVGQFVGQTGPKTKKIFEKALGKVLFIDEAYRLAEGHFAQESMDEIVALMTDEKFIGKMMVILAGYDHDMNRLMNVNTGLSSRFPETITFTNMPVDRCIELLRKELAKDKVAFPTLDDTASASYAEMTQLLTDLASLNSWGNGRDIKTLAGQIVREAFKRGNSASPQSELTVDDEDALECARAMLKERMDRERKINRRPSHNMNLPTATDSKRQEPPPPAATSSSSTQQQPPAAPPTPSPASPQRGRNQGRGSGDPGRDPGVPDHVWQSLQEAKRRQEEIERLAREEQAELERQKAEKKREEEEIARRKRELEEQERRAKEARDEAERMRLVQQREAERLRELAIKRERERIERVLREKKRLEEQRKQQEAQVQRKLRSMGVCPVGYQWLPHGGGYRCAGGSHFVSNAQLGI